MQCQTIKPGIECIFMEKVGCKFNGGKCYPATEKCFGCSRIIEYAGDKYCTTYANPPYKWQSGKCNLASHIVKEVKAEVKKTNPLKASKRESGRR